MPTLVKDILTQLELGNPVAEFDQDLSQYFLPTDAFRKVLRGSADMVTGGKGTGKTAIYQFLLQSKSTLPQLRDIRVIAGVNPSGEPLFRRLGNEEPLKEGPYVTLWKLYFLSLISNWIIKNAPRPASRDFEELVSLMRKTDLLSAGDTAGSVFPRLMDWLRSQMRPKAVGVDVGFNEYGFPQASAKIEIAPGEAHQTARPDDAVISHTEAFSILERVLAERSITAWVVMDRLDESFAGRPDIEIPALRALVRTFMDLVEFPHIRIKLFVRSDLFRKITQENFVNLTHVNARKTEIIWEDDDLLALLGQRIRNNQNLLSNMGLYRYNNTQLVNTFFSEKIDPQRNQLTWKWMLNQIRDGNGIKAPRNLIDLCSLAQDEQLRKERRQPTEFIPGACLIQMEAIKKAAARLSEMRLEDTLLSESSSDVKTLINAFRNSKVEHNEESVAHMFHVNPQMAQMYIRTLMDIGLLERNGEFYQIPHLYRAGLNVTRGRALLKQQRPSPKK